jgi:hypothetical protein
VVAYRVRTDLRTPKRSRRIYFQILCAKYLLMLLDWNGDILQLP